MQVVPSTEAPRMEIIRHIIEEDGEIYEQVDSYNNETGEVVINVPSHGDRDPVNILLDPNTRTLVASTEGKCQSRKCLRMLILTALLVPRTKLSQGRMPSLGTWRKLNIQSPWKQKRLFRRMLISCQMLLMLNVLARKLS